MHSKTYCNIVMNERKQMYLGFIEIKNEGKNNESFFFFNL